MKIYRKLLSFAAICALLALIVYYYNNIKIPQVENKSELRIRREIDESAMPKAKVAVVKDKNGISKYTELTQKVLEDKVAFIEIPTKYTAQNVVSDLKLLEGKITKEDLRLGEQIVVESLSAGEKWFGEYQRLKEYPVSSIVAEQVKAGNIIDLLVSYGDGTYDVVVSKLKVIKLITETENQLQSRAALENQTTPNPGVSKYTVVLALDEEQYRDLELAKTLGKLETRLYLDESQPASKKSFNYQMRLNGRNINNKAG